MPIPYNPLVWKNYDPWQKGAMKLILQQIGEDVFFLNGITGNPANLGSAVSSTFRGSPLGVITSSPTIDATGAVTISVSFSVTGALNPTLTLTNLQAGTTVQVRFSNGAGSARTLKIAASGFTILGDLPGIAEFDFTSTGIAVNAGLTVNVIGIAIASTQLSFTGSVT